MGVGDQLVMVPGTLLGGLGPWSATSLRACKLQLSEWPTVGIRAATWSLPLGGPGGRARSAVTSLKPVSTYYIRQECRYLPIGHVLLK